MPAAKIEVIEETYNVSMALNLASFGTMEESLEALGVSAMSLRAPKAPSF